MKILPINYKVTYLRREVRYRNERLAQACDLLNKLAGKDSPCFREVRQFVGDVKAVLRRRMP